MSSTSKVIFSKTGWVILIAALGYFVDIYDLILFSIVRQKSLLGLGVEKDNLLPIGVILINWQMGGMLLGGLLWGILGDKKGRVSVLFGSIFLYSTANLLNGFVQSVNQYAALRFIAGLGLAGELGAGITLVSEIMSKETRGYGTMIVATIGVSGAIFAALIGDYFTWRTAYLIGGFMGFILLFFRIGVYESGMFNSVIDSKVKRGDFFLLFKSWHRMSRYLFTILLAVPVWYVIGILITFSPEIAKDMGMAQLPNPARAVLCAYIGITMGDFSSGYLSQVFKSRKNILVAYILMTIIFVMLYFRFASSSLTAFYAIVFGLGISTGYWAVFVTTAAELFGTNIRATVTTTAPNFVRGSVLLLTGLFSYFKSFTSTTNAAMAVGVITFIFATIAVFSIEETFGKDLDYFEN